MQKLLKRNTYTPTDTSLVCSSVAVSLNREETLSEHGLKTFDNTLEENRPQHREGQTLSAKVYVISVGGESLMPTTPRKARILLNRGKAKVIRKTPFTVQLTFQTTRFIQPITLGIDSGYKNIGFSTITDNKELMSGEVKLDNMMSKRLGDRAMYRRQKRNKLWYRKPRFNNRVSSKKKGWLPPSIQRRYDTHLNLVNKIKGLLPITKVIIEVGNFDIQKLNNPEIESNGYQEGSLYQYQNVRSFIISREKGKCQLCGKDKGSDSWRLHHIITQLKGGTDKPNNFALLHLKCHKKLHKQGLENQFKKNKQYKASTFMNIIKNKFQQDLDCDITFGYKTYVDRCELGLEKSHGNDAFVIAGGNGQERIDPFKVMQKRKNNRCLQKNRRGFAPAIRKQRYPIQPKDLVQIAGEWSETTGTHCKGSRIMVNKKSINIRLVESVFHTGTLIWRQAISPKLERLGFLA